MRDFLGTNYGKDFDNAFGKGTGKAIMHATAGRCVKLFSFQLVFLVLTTL